MAGLTGRGTTKSRGRKDERDKFYTKPEVAGHCIDFAGTDGYDLIIEPSAGAGAFSGQIPGCLALDIRPEAAGIREQNWLDFEETRVAGRRVLVIGNPPFGQQNNLAVAFMNHAARFADVVAFVLPISFKKASVQARLDPHLHLARELAIPSASFTVGGRSYAVGVVFQVWEWRPESRLGPERRLVSPHFRFVDRAEADLRIGRVGGNAGRASRDLTGSAQSNYFVKVDRDVEVEEFAALVNGLTFPSSMFGVGPRTISKDELVREIDGALEARPLAA